MIPDQIYGESWWDTQRFTNDFKESTAMVTAMMKVEEITHLEDLKSL